MSGAVRASPDDDRPTKPGGKKTWVPAAAGKTPRQIRSAGWRLGRRQHRPGVCNNTVLDTLLLIGQRCTMFLEDTVIGVPVMDRVCTSHVERNNLTMRMWMRRFTRLTMGFSRKLLNHEAALGLYFAAYNFVVKHGTIKTTPAVAAGIADKAWTVAELIERTACYNPPTAFEQFIDSLPDEE
jgi:IS1 transposase